MAWQVKIILDSKAPCEKRITTITATYPRFIHSEVLTHRDRARNSASSRAIPWPKMREMIVNDPVIPLIFGSEKKGMQTGGEIEDPQAAQVHWLCLRDEALARADALAELGVHKSIVNRCIEPWMWITVVMTATEWNNFFRQRCHPDAEIHFQKIAGMIRDALNESKPRYAPSQAQGWHLPFVTGVDLDELLAEFPLEQILQISAARCARVSYLTHEGKRDPQKDIDLFQTLLKGSGFGHWSPLEHPAQGGMAYNARSGPFLGWKQFRKMFRNENAEG